MGSTVLVTMVKASLTLGQTLTRMPCDLTLQSGSLQGLVAENCGPSYLGTPRACPSAAPTLPKLVARPAVASSVAAGAASGGGCRRRRVGESRAAAGRQGRRLRVRRRVWRGAASTPVSGAFGRWATATGRARMGEGESAQGRCLDAFGGRAAGAVGRHGAQRTHAPERQGTGGGGTPPPPPQPPRPPPLPRGGGPRGRGARV